MLYLCNQKGLPPWMSVSSEVYNKETLDYSIHITHTIYLSNLHVCIRCACIYLYPYSVSMDLNGYEGICVCLISACWQGWLPSWPFSLQLWHFPLRHNKGVDFFSLNLSPSLLPPPLSNCSLLQQNSSTPSALRFVAASRSDIFVSLSLSPPYLLHRLIFVSLFTLRLDLSQPPFLPPLLFVFSSLCLRRDLKYKCCNETATQATAVGLLTYALHTHKCTSL